MARRALRPLPKVTSLLPRPGWRPLDGYALYNERTGEAVDIELQPEYGSGYYFVVDVRNGEKTISDALPIRQAKESGIYQAKRLGRI